MTFADTGEGELVEDEVNIISLYNHLGVDITVDQSVTRVLTW